jgi:hypothetical protein
MAVAFDTTVSRTGSTSPGTMTATPTAGTAGLLFVATVTDFGATSVISATYDGAAMTRVGAQIDSGPYLSRYYGHLAVFKIDSAPSGSKTISVSCTGTVTGNYATFISYSGVGSIGSLQSTTGATTSMSHATTSATDNMVAQSFFSPLASSITSYSKTQRGKPANTFIVGDSVGAPTVTFTATTNSASWQSIGVDLASAGTTTTITPGSATVTVTGTAPSLVTTTVLTPAAATITVTGTAPKLEHTVSPPGGSLTGALITITGTAPTLTMSLVTTGTTITITGGTPSTAGEAILTPAAATITVTGTAPTLLLSVVPGSETLPVTGGTPTLILMEVLAPPPAQIGVTGGTPVLILPIALQPSAAAITVTGGTPNILLPNVISPPKADIAVTGGTATLTVAVYVAPVPTIRDTLTVRRESRVLVVSGSRTHIVKSASRTTQA